MVNGRAGALGKVASGEFGLLPARLPSVRDAAPPASPSRLMSTNARSGERSAADRSAISREPADGQPPSADPGTACAAAWKPILEWVPSQNGFFVDAPQRHSQTLPFVGRILPSLSRSSTAPVTR